MEKDLKELVDKYIETNSVKLVQKAAPAPKQPKAPPPAAAKPPTDATPPDEGNTEPQAASKETAPEEAPTDGKKVGCGLGK